MNPRVHRSRVTHDRWLVSYADFITLLFAFFVVLYAFAKADQQKHSNISDAVDGAFQSLALFPLKSPGPTTSHNTMSEHLRATVIDDEMSVDKVRDDLEQMKHELEHQLASDVANGTVAIGMSKDGLVISLREAGFFNSGSATPRPQTLGTLRQIAAAIGRTAYDVRVEGHTDNIPIHNQEFDSNWELSSARAIYITRVLLQLQASTPERLSAAGYAEYHPIESNDTPEGRAHNRRVDLIVLPHSSFNLAAPRPKAAGGWAKITDDSPSTPHPAPSR